MEIISFLNILDLPLRDEVVFMGAVVENLSHAIYVLFIELDCAQVVLLEII